MRDRAQCAIRRYPSAVSQEPGVSLRWVLYFLRIEFACETAPADPKLDRRQPVRGAGRYRAPL
jgi:hypothetical protein